ncbi:MAG: hypothetical protein K2O09_08445 [Treponemataceae bacterium]|nr:hypothetical protein [Treponemataceae bacterium]
MDRIMLLAGKDVPAGSEFAAAVSQKERVPVITAPSDYAVQQPESDYSAIPWNRSSALSARALLLHCLNMPQRLDEAVLIFDEPHIAAEYNHSNLTDNARIIDELIIGYHYVTQEILTRFEQKKTRDESNAAAKIVFLYKANSSQADAVANSAVRAGTISSPHVSAAAAAFKAFAENTAALHAENPNIYPVLVSCDVHTEVAHKDTTLASWLCDYLDSIDELKKRPAPKQLVSWIKAGAKKAGGFGLF